MTGNPNIMYKGNGDCIIQHREYFSDILGSVNFAANSFSINAGLSAMFPWLSQIANRFESYKFRKLSFEYETQAPTTSTGFVVVSVDYDASDVAPVSKSQAMSYQESVRSPPWDSCIHNSHPQNLSKRSEYYTRPGAIPASSDIKLYDVGNLFVCTGGQASTATIGEMWVCYEVLLSTPQTNNDALGLSISSSTGLSGANLIGTPTSVSGNLPYSISGPTLTFLTDWQGIVTANIVGTAITTGEITWGGTATSASAGAVVNAGGTTSYDLAIVIAARGQTLSPTITATTVTASALYFGEQ